MQNILSLSEDLGWSVFLTTYLRLKFPIAKDNNKKDEIDNTKEIMKYNFYSINLDGNSMIIRWKHIVSLSIEA